MANISGLENMQRKLEGSIVLKMAEFEERLKAASSPTNPTVKQLYDEFHTFKDIVTSMFTLMQHQIQDCIKGIDTINMYKRRKALLFNGLSEATKENLEQNILMLLHDKMGFSDMNSSCLKQCFRLGVPHDGRSRPVLVYFSDHHIKSKVWSAKSKLKGSTVSVSEFLTRLRQDIYKSARSHFGMKNVWSLDGYIYIKHPEGRTKISTQNDLDALMHKFPSQNASKIPPKTPGIAETKRATIALHSSTVPTAGHSRRQQVSTVVHEDDSKRSRRLPNKK